MSEFTSGPWRAFRLPKSHDYNSFKPAIKQDKEHGLVLMVHTFDGQLAEANTRLAAAAPDMYEALKEFCDLCDLENTAPELCEVCKAKAALAKAEGK